MTPEQDKPAAARGKYLSPAAYGLPAERGEGYSPPTAPEPDGQKTRE